MLTLHYFPGTIAGTIAIALNEAGLPYQGHLVDFAKGEQTSSPYLAINPKGRVPALETERGVVTETAAVLDYIATLAPEANLVPKDAFLAAHMRSVMLYLASTMHVNHAHRMRGARWASTPEAHADMKANVARTMSESCAYIEAHALRGPFVCGEEVTLADPYLYVVSNWLEGDKVDINDYPQFAAFQARMAQRASVQKASEEGYLSR